MARYKQEYQRTQDDVMRRTTLLQRQGSWLVILAVLLAALTVGVILNVYAWDIGYSIRTHAVERGMAEDKQVLDAYLEEGDYGKFMGYYNANDISLDYNNSYHVLWTAASSYVDLIQYVTALNDRADYSFSPEHVSNTCSYIAEYLNRIYTIEQQYSYDLDRYLPADKRVYLEDIRDRTAAIARAYFGLTDEQIQEIPNISTKRLATIIEEGIAS